MMKKMFGFVRNLLNVAKKVFFPVLAIFSLVSAEIIERSSPETSEKNGKEKGPLSYNTKGYSDDHFLILEKEPEILSVLRNIDTSKIEIKYSGSDFLKKIQSLPEPGFIIYAGDICKIVTSEFTDAETVTFAITKAGINDVFQEAEVHLESKFLQSSETGDPKRNIDVPICLGINADNSCKRAKGPIPIYSNAKYGVDVSCTNCFLGFYTDVFFDISISSFHLKSLSGGLRNSFVDGAMVLSAKEQYAWGIGYDKTVNILPPTTIISFHIGIIPVRLWVTIDLQEKFSTAIDVSASLVIGEQMRWNLGDNYMSWDSGSGWVKHHSIPTFTFTPVFEVSGNLHSDTMASLIPKMQFHVDNVYSFEVDFIPTLYGTVQGSLDTKQICGTLSYEIQIQTRSELHLDLAFIHVNKVFGPEIVYDSGVKPIGTKCLHFMP